jgi:hypothetical protein
MKEINLEKYKEYYKEFPNDLKIELLNMFLGQYSEHLDLLEKGLIEKDAKKINRGAHDLKNDFGSLMALDICNLCKVIMESSRFYKENNTEISDSDLNVCKEYTERINSKLDPLFEDIEELKASLS